MEIQRQRWDEYYRGRADPPKDSWLRRYEPAFRSRPEPVLLDLGCGNGSNLEYLGSFGGSVHALDYSEEAIAQVRSRFEVEARVADIREPLPYADGSFDFVVSDLSLHYFSEADTFRALDELRRVLKPSGALFARLNSLKDKLHGAQQGTEIESCYYEHNQVRKRFFTEESIRRFFEPGFELLVLEERTSGKYLEEKHLWELAARPRA